LQVWQAFLSDRSGENNDNDNYKKSWLLNAGMHTFTVLKLRKTPSMIFITINRFCSQLMTLILSVLNAVLLKPEFDWNPSTIGLVDSSFFWGYLVTQIPGGYLASRMPANL
jgi:fucose permease